MINILSKILIKKVQDDYDAIADSFSDTRQSPWEGWKLFQKYFDTTKTVLDIGCGNGRLSDFFEYKSYAGIDISKQAKFGPRRRRGQNKGANRTFVKGSSLDIPFSKKFDIVISIAAFHHLPSRSCREKALKEVKNVLKSDGIFIFSVWNLFYNERHVKNRKKALLLSILTFGLTHPRDLFIPWKKGLNKRKRYYYAFKKEELCALLSCSGFEILEIIPEIHGKKVPLEKSLNIYFVCKCKNQHTS